jgi:integrase
MENISINKEAKSPFYMVTFRDAQGRQRRRSTKVPVGGGLFQGEKLTAKQAEKRAFVVGAELAKQQSEADEKKNTVSVRAFLTEYISRAGKRLTEQSMRNVRSACAQFCAWLGKRADFPLAEITRLDCKKYVEFRREKIRHSSVVRETGCLKTAFADAFDSEIIARNPWTNIKIAPDKESEKNKREAFTMEELQYIIDHFPPEWSSAVRCSFETFGQRLGDIIQLRWRHFDWKNRVVRFVTQKTGRELAQPMRESFYNWARAEYEASGCDDNALLHPRLASDLGAISTEFTNLLRSHGIGVKRGERAGDRKNMHSKTFHSIRATAATFLHACGVSQGMAMKLVGHNSAAIHEIYVKPNADLLREAAEKLPQL